MVPLDEISLNELFDILAAWNKELETLNVSEVLTFNAEL